MSQQTSDRHKAKRTVLSGSAKRQAKAEKQNKQNEVLSRTRSMSEFVIAQSKLPSSNTKDDASPGIEQSFKDNDANCITHAPISSEHEYEKQNKDNVSIFNF